MKFILRIACIAAVLLLLWQGIVSFWALPDYILPSPPQVFRALLDARAVIAANFLPTLTETLLGFIFGILFGCCAGMLSALFRPVAFWFLPLLVISQAIPTFAIAPLIVIWLGYGLSSKIVTTVIMIFFPVASAFYDGLCRTDQTWLTMASSMNAGRWQTFRRIRLPAALPALASGIRIAAVMAPIGAIVGEWVGSSQGLGYLMLNANARLQIDMMFGALIVIIMLGLALYFSVDKLLRRLIWWQ